MRAGQQVVVQVHTQAAAQGKIVFAVRAHVYVLCRMVTAVATTVLPILAHPAAREQYAKLRAELQVEHIAHVHL